MKLSMVPPLVFLCSGLAFQEMPNFAAVAAFSSETNPPVLIKSSVSASRRSKQIFHPSTQSCVLRKLQHDPLKLGPCEQVDDAWNYTPQKFLVVKGTYYCLQAVESGKPAKLGIICTESDSQWDFNLQGEKRISTRQADNTTLCLDVGADNTVITSPCLPASGSDESSSENQDFEYESQSKIRSMDNFAASAALP